MISDFWPFLVIDTDLLISDIWPFLVIDTDFQPKILLTTDFLDVESND